ncbi:MAG: hypothetical protein KBA14_03325 [Saprospiraceae bacterium]|nr:hypothetical protein [Saprospiraceae bacterium]
MKAVHILRRLLLLVFLSCGFISLTSAYFIVKFQLFTDSQLFLITYFGYGCIPLMLLFYKPSLFKDIPMHMGLLLLTFFGYSIFLAIAGLLSGNQIATWLVDSVTFTAFSGFIFLGTSKAFWEDFQKFGFYFFIAAIAVNIQATTMIKVNYWLQEDNLLNFKGGERITRSIVGYRTQFSQSFWPLFLLTLNPKNRLRLFFILAAVLFLLLQQIIFQKRGPTVRILFFIGCFIYLAWKNKEYGISTVKLLRGVGLFLVFSILTFVAFKQYLPADLLRKQYEALVNRFEGDVGNANIKYTEGALGVFTSENERVREVGMMLRSLDVKQIVVGKGFGGKYKDIEILKKERDATHIGVFNFMLKGGIVYLFLFALLIASLWIKRKLYYQDRDTLVCFLIFLGMTIFLFAEGWFYYRGQVYDLMLYGVVIGQLIVVKGHR